MIGLRTLTAEKPGQRRGDSSPFAPAPWTKDGLCHGWLETSPGSPDWFAEPASSAEAGAAALICTACPVRQICLDAAVARGEKYGVWGGVQFTESCTNGHEKTDETWVNRPTPNRSERWVCLTCQTAACQRSRAKRTAKAVAAKRTTKALPRTFLVPQKENR